MLPLDYEVGSNIINILVKFKEGKLRKLGRLKSMFLLKTKESFSINDGYVVVHWRRGDQSRTRCKGIDKSVNCKDAEFLIKYIQQYVFSRRGITKTMKRILIATDEKNPRQLQKLRNADYVVIHDILNSSQWREQYSVAVHQRQSTSVIDSDFYSMEELIDLLVSSNKYFPTEKTTC